MSSLCRCSTFVKTTGEWTVSFAPIRHCSTSSSLCATGKNLKYFTLIGPHATLPFLKTIFQCAYYYLPGFTMWTAVLRISSIIWTMRCTCTKQKIPCLKPSSQLSKLVRYGSRVVISFPTLNDSHLLSNYPMVHVGRLRYWRGPPPPKSPHTPIHQPRLN